MVKTFTGIKGGREKIPVRRKPDSTTATEIERNMGEDIRTGEEPREAITNVAEDCEVQRSCEEEAALESEKSGNETEIVGASDNTSIDGDDCGVIDDDGDFFAVQLSEDAHFVEASYEDLNADYDSNDICHDMWDDEHIPDPLSDDDREQEEYGRRDNCGPDELLALGHTFNNAEEFKYAVLKYSLKTQYDIMFYKSSVDRLGARCTQHIEGKCQWRVYCSFERGRNKLMVKVFINDHICVRSGYTKLVANQ